MLDSSRQLCYLWCSPRFLGKKVLCGSWRGTPGGRSRNGTCLELDMLVLLVMSCMFEMCVHVFFNASVLEDSVILGVCLSRRLACYSSRAAMLHQSASCFLQGKEVVTASIFLKAQFFARRSWLEMWSASWINTLSKTPAAICWWKY